MTGNLDINAFTKIYHNAIQMFIDRQYVMTEYLKKKKIIQKTDEELLTSYKENNCRLVLTKKTDTVTVYFFNEKVGINEMKDLFKTLQEDEEGVSHLILITKHKLTSYAKKEMKLLGKNMEKEIFYFDELIFNITQHVLVPQHELLTEEEHKLFLAKFGKKVPHIKITDKLCRYYNGKIDQVFRIYRKAELYYRIVVL